MVDIAAMCRDHAGMADIVCILIGIIAIVGGLSGTMILKGTHSSVAYAMLGVAFLIFGATRVSRHR